MPPIFIKAAPHTRGDLTVANRSPNVVMLLNQIAHSTLSSQGMPRFTSPPPLMMSGRLIVYILASKTNGVQIIAFQSIKIEAEERHEDLYQRLMACVKTTSFHQAAAADKGVSPTLEVLIIFRWLELIDPQLPNLAWQHDGIELPCRTLRSIKPDIFQALPTLLTE